MLSNRAATARLSSLGTCSDALFGCHWASCWKYWYAFSTRVSAMYPICWWSPKVEFEAKTLIVAV